MIAALPFSLRLPVGIALCVGIFFLGRVLGASLSKSEPDSLPAPGDTHPPVTALKPQAAGESLGGGYEFSETAQQLLALFDGSRGSNAEFTAALAELKGAQLDQLVDELLTHKLPSQMRRMANIVYRHWAEIDTASKAAKYFGPGADSSDRRYTLRSMLIETLAAADPIAAMRYALKFGDGAQDRMFFGEALRVLMRRDPAAAARVMIEHDLFSQKAYAKTYTASNLMLYWAKVDPTAAARFVSEMPECQSRDYAIKTLAETWAKTDPSAAYEWLRGLDQDDDKAASKALTALMAAATKADPNFVLQFINDAGDGQMRGRVLVNLAKHYATADAESAAEWVGSLEGYNETLNAGIGVIDGLPAGDLGNFDKIAANTPPSTQSRLWQRFAMRWADNDPEDAIAWARTLESRQLHDAVDGIVGQLTHSDGGTHHAQLAELIELEPNVHRIYGPNLADTWSQVDAAAAFDWATRTPLSDRRDRALDDVIEVWGKQDPVAARAAVDAAEALDEAGRERLIGKIPTTK